MVQVKGRIEAIGNDVVRVFMEESMANVEPLINTTFKVGDGSRRVLE